MFRNLKFLIAAAVGVAALTLTACTPAQLQAFHDLNPAVGSAVTPATANDEQRSVLRYIEEQHQAQITFLEAVRRHEQQQARVGSIQMHPFLVCVRRYESDRGPYPHTNGYGAHNPTSSASGAYQFIDGTWRSTSVRAGHPGYARASHAPWYVQDEVALWLFNNGGRSAWNGSGC